MRQQLYPGRYCEASYECLSKSCVGNTCLGLAIGTSCFSHSDCTTGLYCQTATAWPYVKACQTLLSVGTACTEDAECSLSAMCWHASAGASKTCMNRYALTDGSSFGWSTTLDSDVTDYEYNGQVCTSGFAYTSGSSVGVCTSAVKVEFNGASISTPYLCDPTNNAN